MRALILLALLLAACAPATTPAPRPTAVPTATLTPYEEVLYSFQMEWLADGFNYTDRTVQASICELVLIYPESTFEEYNYKLAGSLLRRAYDDFFAEACEGIFAEIKI